MIWRSGEIPGPTYRFFSMTFSLDFTVLEAKLRCNRLAQKSIAEQIKIQSDSATKLIMVDALLDLIEKASGIEQELLAA